MLTVGKRRKIDEGTEPIELLALPDIQVCHNVSFVHFFPFLFPFQRKGLLGTVSECKLTLGHSPEPCPLPLQNEHVFTVHAEDGAEVTMPARAAGLSDVLQTAYTAGGFVKFDSIDSGTLDNVAKYVGMLNSETKTKRTFSGFGHVQGELDMRQYFPPEQVLFIQGLAPSKVFHLINVRTLSLLFLFLHYLTIPFV